MTRGWFFETILNMQWLWVIGFGVIGVGSRFAIDSWVARFSFPFPVGTLAINIAGCFLAGLLFGSNFHSDQSGSQLRIGVIVGFCGGFTTFSGFGLQFMQLMNDGRIAPAVAYGIASPVLCVLATAGGLVLARAFT